MENEQVEAPQETVASVGAPESVAGELAALKDLAGGSPVLTVVLALIAVVGGKAGWKFFSDRSKLKHEEEMKKLEIEEKKTKAEALKQKIKKAKSKE